MKNFSDSMQKFFFQKNLRRVYLLLTLFTLQNFFVCGGVRFLKHCSGFRPPIHRKEKKCFMEIFFLQKIFLIKKKN